MPRNSSGTYSLPAGNPVVSNTLIQSTWANSTLSDVSTAMTDSLDRNGRGAMLAPLKNVDGSAVAPAFTFSSEGTLGIFRAAAGVLGFAVGGALVLSLTSTGLTFTTPLVIPLGTAAAPALAFVGNTNTGIYSPGTSQVSISTAGVDRLAVGATGTVTLSAGALVLGAAGANLISATNAAGTLAFQTGGANNRITIDASGNTVFIGASSFSSTVAHVGNVTFNNAVSMLWKDSGGSAHAVAFVNASNAIFLGDVGNAFAGSITHIGANSSITQDVNGSTITTVNASGLGIGKAPVVALDVTSGTASVAQFNSSNASGSYLTMLNTGVANGYFGSAASLSSGGGLSDLAIRATNNLQFATGGSTERMRIDATGNIGVAVIPSNAFASGKTLQIVAGGATIYGSATGAIHGQNVSFDAAGSPLYQTTATALIYRQSAGVHQWQTAPSGTAGTAATFTQCMAISGTVLTLNVPATLSAGNATLMLGFDSTNASGGFTSYSSSGTQYGYVGSGLGLVSGGLIGDFALRATANMIFSIGSGERMRITSAGLVQVVGPEGLRTVNDAGFISFYNTANTLRTGFIQATTASTLAMSAENGASLVFNTAGAQRLVITTGGVIQDAAGFELGWKDIPQNAQGSAYTLVIGDRGKHVYITTAVNVTVPASVFSTGNIVTVVNGNTTSISLVQGASTTLYQTGTTNTGTRTILPRGICTVLCVGANAFYIGGNIT